MRVHRAVIVGLLAIVASLLFVALALGQPLPGAQAAPGVPPVTLTPSVTPTPTATPPSGDITLTGQVTDAWTGQGLAHAIVSVASCFPRAYSATTGPDGRYSLFLPGDYFTCGTAPLRVEAAGYLPFTQTFSTSELRSRPTRDFALTPLHLVYLPLISQTAP